MGEVLIELGHHPIHSYTPIPEFIDQCDLIISDQPIPTNDKIIYTEPYITCSGKRLIKPFGYKELIETLKD